MILRTAADVSDPYQNNADDNRVFVSTNQAIAMVTRVFEVFCGVRTYNVVMKLTEMTNFKHTDSITFCQSHFLYLIIRWTLSDNVLCLHLLAYTLGDHIWTPQELFWIHWFHLYICRIFQQTH